EGDDSSLWIGTFGGGVSRYKGGQFTVYTTGEGLISDFVRSLCKDREGGIWIGTDHGLSRFKDGRFVNYTVKDGLADNSIRGLYCDEDGSVWVITSSALGVFRGGRFYHQNIEGPKPGTEGRAVRRHRGDLCV